MTAGWSAIPASSANLGAGFDVLGMALDAARRGRRRRSARRRGAWSTTATPPTSPSGGWAARDLWMRSPIPIGRGLGFSGAVRVGGAAAAVVQTRRAGALDDAGDAGRGPRADG